MMLSFVSFFILTVNAQSKDANEPLVEEAFPFRDEQLFHCYSSGRTYQTAFTFLDGLGRGFVHAEPHRIFFEYYFPAEHWVGFGAANQIIEGDESECSQCYFNNYYPSNINTNHSNLYPKCIEECLDDSIFVATVNANEQDKDKWDVIEFQIDAQKSKKLNRKMYRIPKPEQLLEVWGRKKYPYRKQAHFGSDIYTVGNTEYIHARFWRKYAFAPDVNSDSAEYGESNEWKLFVESPEGKDLVHPDSLCFVTIASFYGGEYPFDDDALKGLLPGFYIDTQHLANIHCFKLDDIKVDCGQDWSWLKLKKGEGNAVNKTEDNLLVQTKEDGGLSKTSLGVLGLIIGAIVIYVLYWFCCTNKTKGYRQSAHLNKDYYDDDDNEYIKNYNERINGGHNQYKNNENEDEDDSDWSEDEEMGLIKDDHNEMDTNNDRTQHTEYKHSHKKGKQKKGKKSKKRKKNKHKKNDEYDVVNSHDRNTDDDDDDDIDKNDDQQNNDNNDDDY